MADRVFRRVMRPRRTMQYQEYTEGLLVGDPDEDFALLIIVKDSKPSFEYKRSMTTAMSEFGTLYVTNSMDPVEGTAVLERLKDMVALAGRHITSLAAPAAPVGGAVAPDAPPPAPPAEKVVIAVAPVEPPPPPTAPPEPTSGGPTTAAV